MEEVLNECLDFLWSLPSPPTDLIDKIHKALNIEF